MPADDEIRNFASFVRQFWFSAVDDAAERDHQLPRFRPWQEAVDVLIRDLPQVIQEALDLESSLYGPLAPGETRRMHAAALDALLLAARDAQMPDARLSYETGPVWHQFAQQIAGYLNGISQRAHQRPFVFSHIAGAGTVITQSALEACGYSVTCDAIVKAFQRNGY